MKELIKELDKLFNSEVFSLAVKDIHQPIISDRGIVKGKDFSFSTKINLALDMAYKFREAKRLYMEYRKANNLKIDE